MEGIATYDVYCKKKSRHRDHRDHIIYKVKTFRQAKTWRCRSNTAHFWGNVCCQKYFMLSSSIWDNITFIRVFTLKFIFPDKSSDLASKYSLTKTERTTSRMSSSAGKKKVGGKIVLNVLIVSSNGLVAKWRSSRLLCCRACRRKCLLIRDLVMKVEVFADSFTNGD